MTCDQIKEFKEILELFSNLQTCDLAFQLVKKYLSYNPNVSIYDIDLKSINTSIEIKFFSDSRLHIKFGTHFIVDHIFNRSGLLILNRYAMESLIQKLNIELEYIQNNQ